MDMMQQTQDQIENEDASPEEQAMYEKAIQFALKSLHSGPTAKNTVARVLNAENTAKGVAAAAFVILRKTEVELGKIDDSVKVQIGEDIVMEILDLMISSGRLQESEVNDQLIEAIVTEIYQRYSKDAESRGGLDADVIRADVEEGEKILGMRKPQGHAAMSNQEAQTRGLMDV